MFDLACRLVCASESVSASGLGCWLAYWLVSRLESEKASVSVLTLEFLLG